MSEIWSAAKIQRELDDSGFCGFLGAKVKQWEPGTRVLTLDLSYRAALGRGIEQDYFHGGATGAFMDTAATFVLMASGTQNCVTTNYRLDLLRPILGGAMSATASIVRRGRTMALVDVELRDAAGKLSATGRASFAILGAE